LGELSGLGSMGFFVFLCPCRMEAKLRGKRGKDVCLGIKQRATVGLKETTVSMKAH
jgi:hypothetical protein